MYLNANCPEAIKNFLLNGALYGLKEIVYGTEEYFNVNAVGLCQNSDPQFHKTPVMRE